MLDNTTWKYSTETFKNTSLFVYVSWMVQCLFQLQIDILYEVIDVVPCEFLKYNNK